MSAITAAAAKAHAESADAKRYKAKPVIDPTPPSHPRIRTGHLPADPVTAAAIPKVVRKSRTVELSETTGRDDAIIAAAVSEIVAHPATTRWNHRIPTPLTLRS